MDINNDPLGLMKDKQYDEKRLSRTAENIYNRLPHVDVGVFMHGRVTSDVEINSENKFLFTLKIQNGMEFLIVAESCSCDMTKPLKNKHVMLSKETERKYEKPRIKFNGKSFAVRYYTKSFGTIG